MEECWNGRMAEWWNGRMAEWRNGRMAEWHNLRYEIVRNQDTESTQMPPWQSPSRLVGNKEVESEEEASDLPSDDSNKSVKSSDNYDSEATNASNNKKEGANNVCN
jgi:hypothetical protein